MGAETASADTLANLPRVFQHHDRAGGCEYCIGFTKYFSQVIGEALARFRLEGEPTDKYQLVKVTLESGRGTIIDATCRREEIFSFLVTESVLNNGDIPWEVLKRRGFESVRLMELTRFYLQLKEDPHGPNVALFVGNLPPNLKQKEYETILLDYLDNGNINIM